MYCFAGSIIMNISSAIY